MRSPDRLVLVGRFGAPQGVRGEVRVQSFTGEPKAIGGYGALSDVSGRREFAFERVRPLKDDMLVVKVKGVETRETAAGLTGVELFARRERLPEPSADEFYIDDLIGLEAVTEAGARLGCVIAVVNYGAGDILEIAPEGGGEALLFPFIKAVVPAIEFDAGRLVVAPPREVEAHEPEAGRDGA